MYFKTKMEPDVEHPDELEHQAANNFALYSVLISDQGARMSISGLPKKNEGPNNDNITLPSNQFEDDESTLIADKPDLDIIPPMPLPDAESRQTSGITPADG